MHERDQLFRMYAATHLNFTDEFKGVLGFSAAKLQTTGYSYGVDEARLNSKASPYAGLLYDLTSNVTLYGSYTSIFNPQSQVDITGRRLANARITDHLHAYANINNVTNRKYLQSLEWGQAYYAPPRNFTISVEYRF